MKLELLKNKRIIILGYGIEGKSAYEFLQHYYPDQKIAMADQKDGPDYLDKQKNYDLAIKSPGIHKSRVTIPYTTATNIFFANVKGTTIGVTGSKGKSTTSSLLYAVLKQAGKKTHLVGNITHTLDQIGTPMLTGLLHSNQEDDTWVCELSSFQLDDIHYSPHISVITSFFPEHMDYHGNVENYFSAKKNIVKFAKPADYFVHNPKFEKLRQLAQEYKGVSIKYEGTDDSILNTLYSNLYTSSLRGEHNLDNLKAAVTVAKLLKIPDETIMKAIKNFTSLPHRLEKVGIFRRITFYDDAIATTPEATIQAIKTLQYIGTIFLGGQDRGFDFSELAKIIDRYSIKNLVLFPETGERIFGSIIKISKKEFRVFRTTNMADAVQFAYRYTPKNTICLLSTASPSYSVWKNFEEKGNLFKQYVKKFSD